MFIFFCLASFRLLCLHIRNHFTGWISDSVQIFSLLKEKHRLILYKKHEKKTWCMIDKFSDSFPNSLE